MKKIMIIYTNYGTGHFKAAEALKKEVNDKYPDILVECFDPLTYTRPVINKLYAYVGKIFATRFRKQRENIYNELMYSKYLEQSNFFAFCTKLFWSRKLQNKINNFKPDLIISTQVGPTGLIAAHNELGDINAKLASVFTDYGLHRMYVLPHKNVDLYFVPTDDIKEDMIKLGIDKNKVHVTGIPVSDKFDSTLYKNIKSKRLQILFVCGGGMGYTNAFKYFKSMLNLNADFEYTFVSGNNKKLYKEATDLASTSNKNGVILGYTDIMPDLMNKADIVIGKPGGLLVSEALSINKPFLAIEPIPGQETQNAKFISNNKFGFYVSNINEFNTTILELSKNKKKLGSYENNIKENFIKDSVSKIINICFKNIK